MILKHFYDFIYDCLCGVIVAFFMAITHEAILITFHAPAEAMHSGSFFEIFKESLLRTSRSGTLHNFLSSSGLFIIMIQTSDAKE